MNSKLEEVTLKKITWRIVPFVMIAYFIAFFDRINIGFAALTMNADLGFSPGVFGFGAGLFFIGMFFTEVPSNIILQKVGPRIWLARIMLSWGIMALCMVFVKTATGFYIIRFFLGVAEAGFFSGIILYLSVWFPIKRRAIVIACFMSAAPLTSVIGSPLAGLILSLHGAFGLKGWQLMFALDAILAVVLAIVTFFYLNDRPEKNTWLTAEETNWLVTTLDSENQNRSTAKTSPWKGLTDIRVLILALVYFGTSAGLYSLNIWSPQFIKSFGFSNLQIGFINALPPLVGIISMILWARHSDTTRERTWHVIIACLVASVGFIFAGTATGISLALVALIMASIGIYSCKAPLWSIPSQFLSGPAAAAGLAAINSIGNLGGFFGPAIIGWLKQVTGNFSYALYAVAGLLILSAILTLVIDAMTKQKVASC